MSLSATGIVTAINECVTLFQWAKSAISSLHSRWSGPQEQSLEDHVLQLESGLQSLRDTLPAMYDLIDKAEWRSHEHGVAKLLPNLNDAMTEAEDLLDEFTWYEKKVQVEGNASQSPFTEFFDTVIQGNFNKLSDVQSRLNLLSSHLENMGICGVTQRFDKLVRPETTSLPNETKIFGRDKELEQLLGYVPAPTNPKRKRATSSINGSTSNQVSNDSRMLILPVLPIVGLGGVGKTTLVQLFCSHQRVLAFYELIIWIYVSDDFDVKRLTKEAIQSCTGNEATSDNLDFLQHALSKHLKNKKFLIVLDDIWDDALKGNGQSWKSFCAPFRNVQEGSMMLVTTRCQKVTKGVRTLEPILLEGLNEYIFWIFFKSCAFGSGSSNNYPELECIGRRILPKLKGSPLAAKTLGRMLSMDLKALHWNFILESELWELRQEDTDILPALRLSYMYLPFYLKQCFAFCAVYPKDYIFQKDCLAKFWVAEGFVESNGGIPVEHIACQYFEDLVFDAKKCMLESLPDEFWKGKVIRLMKNLNQFRGDLEITNVHMLSKENAAEAVLKNKKYLDELILNMQSRIIQNNELEVAQLLQPPISLKSLSFLNYECVSLPTWFFQPQNLPSFVSLTDITIDGCENISSLEHFLHPDYVPAIKKIRVEDCEMLASVPTDNFGGFHFLEELHVARCPNSCSQRLVSPSLKKLYLHGSGLFRNIDCCSLTFFYLVCDFVTSIQLEMWSLPALRELHIRCGSLASIVGSTDLSTAFSCLGVLKISHCNKLSTLDDLLTQEYLPAIEKIDVECCPELLSLPGESLTSLTSLSIAGCKGITSIAGDIWRCNLASLEELAIQDCPDLVSIGGAKAVAEIKQVTIHMCPKCKEANQINIRSRQRYLC
ncbi:hypothetical protein CFC21_026809 [Triticum aestivum]|uniref:NB-ARC domain-containing protein n=2 Tax=Triticum aestivum TaxID=4565 RepID=A0A9R1JCN8_WHEAT|nr:hypothetical protein CFC21_026809 [Triticum aestivum]